MGVPSVRPLQRGGSPVLSTQQECHALGEELSVVVGGHAVATGGMFGSRGQLFLAEAGYRIATETDGNPPPCFITAQSFGLVVIGSSLRQSHCLQTRAPILGENFLK